MESPKGAGGADSKSTEQDVDSHSVPGSDQWDKPAGRFRATEGTHDRNVHAEPLGRRVMFRALKPQRMGKNRNHTRYVPRPSWN